MPADPTSCELVDRTVPEPGPGEVRVRVAFSGVNPTDWKSRSTADPGPDGKIPNQDGSGVVDAVGEGVDPVLVGERVWIWEAAYQRPYGTAAEYTVVPARQTVLLGADASFELGAALAIPFLTAHRCLTVAESLPDRIGPGSLSRAHRAGAGRRRRGRERGDPVGAPGRRHRDRHGQQPGEGAAAAAAGADHVVDYRQQDVVAEVRKIAPKGVDAIVEVSAAVNAGIDAQVIGMHGAVAMYADDGGAEVTVPVRLQMAANARWQFVLVYTEPARAKALAVEDVNAAVLDGAIRVGREAAYRCTSSRWRRPPRPTGRSRTGRSARC